MNTTTETKITAAIAKVAPSIARECDCEIDAADYIVDAALGSLDLTTDDFTGDDLEFIRDVATSAYFDAR